MGKKALITGITGQDGSYLAELLLDKDYDIHGLIRNDNHMENVNHIADLITFHYADLTDYSRLAEIVKIVCPSEVYHLAAMSQVGKSFSCPLHTAEVNALGSHKLMEAVFTNCTKARFYQASTSEMYGDVDTEVQDENTRFCPVSPYGISKLYAHNTAQVYRANGRFVSCGILFNHESPRRHGYFVTRKIAKGVARIAVGSKEPIRLGNLDAMRDWGFAAEYVEGMHLMLQQKVPRDYVLATGHTHSVREFCTKAFKLIGKNILWWGDGQSEQGILEDGTIAVQVEAEYYRPSEIGRLCGDSRKAEKLLGWKAEMPLEDLVKIMVKRELEEYVQGDIL